MMRTAARHGARLWRALGQGLGGLQAAHPVCLGCEAIGQVRATEVTDHVEPHKGDMVKFWNSEQWQPACQLAP
jgi:5-methylcytosine-specific restriction protein A